MQKKPKLDETERRFKADEIDFREDNIKKAKISKKYINDDFDRCYDEIIKDIREMTNA